MSHLLLSSAGPAPAPARDTHLRRAVEPRAAGRAPLERRAAGCLPPLAVRAAVEDLAFAEEHLDLRRKAHLSKIGRAHV